MPDLFTSLRQGEERVFTATGVAKTGTLTITGNAQASLYDAAGALADGYPVDVTGQTTGAAATVEAWLDLNTSALDPGAYRLQIEIVAEGSDGNERTYLSQWEFTVGALTDPIPLRDYSRYPCGADLALFLAGTGLAVSDALAQQLDATAGQAVLDFEGAVFRRMLAGAEEIRAFTPRGGLLQLDDLAAAPSLVRYVPQNGDPETLALDTDYLLEPANALLRGVPITRLRLRGWFGRMPGLLPSVWGEQTLRITGRWGYGTTIPADAWQAMLARAAHLCVPQLALGVSRGLVSVRSMNSQIAYAAGPVTPLSAEDAAWQKTYDDAVRSYRRMQF